MATETKYVRLTIIKARQEALDEEKLVWKNKFLSLMHRFANRFTDRRPGINRLNSLPDDLLIEYGRYALGCMAGLDIRKVAYLKSVRDEFGSEAWKEATLERELQGM
ncbi:hypothetical protein Tco_0329300 [Tanacetum coccineum]